MFLREGLSLNMELANSATQVGQQAPEREPPVSFSPVLGFQAPCPALLHGFWGGGVKLMLPYA